LGAVDAGIESAVFGNEWFGQQIGDPLDGVISIDDVCRLAGLTIIG
jgi:hypothetical protein